MPDSLSPDDRARLFDANLLLCTFESAVSTLAEELDAEGSVDVVREELAMMQHVAKLLREHGLPTLAR
jgi:hypothetical protein